MLYAPFTKKRTHNLGPIYLQKNDVLELDGVGKWEVGAKCSVMQGCRVGGRLGVRSCWSMVQVVASTLCRALGWGKALALVGVECGAILEGKNPLAPFFCSSGGGELVEVGQSRGRGGT